jgi:hypothetical protein
MLKKKEKRIKNREPLRKWFWSLVFASILCLFSYGYCVRAAIVNIVERQNVEKELSILNSKIIDLESEYIKVKNNITLETANSLGFVPASTHKFVSKSIKNPGLSMVLTRN